MLKITKVFLMLIMMLSIPNFVFAGVGIPALTDSLNIILDILSNGYVITILFIAISITVYFFYIGKLDTIYTIKIGGGLLLMLLAPNIADALF